MRERRKPDGTLTFRTVLKLKLQVSADQASDLEAIAALCRRGLNAGAVNWLMRQHGLPLSEKQANRLCKHKAHEGREKSESTRIYHAVREASPGLTADVHSMLANQIASYLSGRLDWREGKTEDGKRPRRKDAILQGSARPPYFTAVEIPVRATGVRFRYFDDAELTCKLLASGATTVAISTRKISQGQRTILKELSAGSRKVPDSKLLLKEGEWYWYVPLAFDAPAVQSDTVAELRPVVPAPGAAWQRQREHPFSLTMPGRDRPWGCGLGEWYVRQCERIEIRRKLIGERYRHRCGSGHGRKKWVCISHRIGLAQRRLTDEVRRKCIAEIVANAERAGCGTILYREPSLPLRDKCWFQANAMGAVNWDWTRFAVDLENAAARRGLRVEKKTLTWKEVFGNASTTAEGVRELQACGDAPS